MAGSGIYLFIDRASQGQCILTFQADGTPVVRHPECHEQADVFPHLDSFYCGACNFNGRLKGSIVLERALALN